MGRSHWRIDPEHPDGYALPFTREEEEQADRDEVAAAAFERIEQAQQDEQAQLLARLDDPDVTATELAAILKAVLG